MSNYYTNEIEQLYYTKPSLSLLNICKDTSEQMFGNSKVNLESIGFIEESPPKAACLNFDSFESILAEEFKSMDISDYPFDLSTIDCPEFANDLESCPSEVKSEITKDTSSSFSNLSKRKPVDSPHSATTINSEFKFRSGASSFTRDSLESAANREKMIFIMESMIDRQEI